MAQKQQHQAVSKWNFPSWRWTDAELSIPGLVLSIPHKGVFSLFVSFTNRKALLLDSAFYKLNSLIFMAWGLLLAFFFHDVVLGLSWIGLWPEPQHHCNPLMKVIITRCFRQFVTWQGFSPPRTPLPKYFLSFIFSLSFSCSISF